MAPAPSKLSPPSVECGHRLYSCFAAPFTCIYGYCCLPCLYGQNVDREEGSGCAINCLIYCCLAQFCLQWIVHTQSRERLRNKYGLEAAPCSDCCVTFWCAPCAVCQEAEQSEYQAQMGGAVKGMQTAPPPHQYMQQGPPPAYTQA